MICRSDLAFEMPPEKIFIAQKWMTEKANIVAKPVIISDECYDSMYDNGKSTRSEAADMSNAILDGVDGIVLGESTSDGAYPMESVNGVAKVISEAEINVDHKRLFTEMVSISVNPGQTAEAVAASAVSVVNELDAKLIIVLTDSGKMGRLVAKYRPCVSVMICS